MPEPDDDPAARTTTLAAASASLIIARRLRKNTFLNATATTSQRRLKRMDSFDAVETSGTSTREGTWVVGEDDGEQKKDESDESDDSSTDTEGSDGRAHGYRRRRHRRVSARVGSRLIPVAECRKHSRSAWLHFPHVELVVLFFAFEGAVASQVSALREGGCSPVMTVAAVALVSSGLKAFAMDFAQNWVFRFVMCVPACLPVSKEESSSVNAGGLGEPRLKVIGGFHKSIQLKACFWCVHAYL